MAQHNPDTSYPTSAPPTGIATRHAHGLRQVLAAVALAAHRSPFDGPARASADRLRSAAHTPTCGWAELLLKR